MSRGISHITAWRTGMLALAVVCATGGTAVAQWLTVTVPGIPRTADVVAETPSVVLRLSRASIERMETAEPELAAALHRWLATTLSERLTDTQRAVGALFD